MTVAEKKSETTNQKDSIPALEVENISKVYDSGSEGKFIALRKVNFSIRRGGQHHLILNYDVTFFPNFLF